MRTKDEMGKIIDAITDLLEKAAIETTKPEEERNLHELALLSFASLSALSIIVLNLIEVMPDDK